MENIFFLCVTGRGRGRFVVGSRRTWPEGLALLFFINRLTFTVTRNFVKRKELLWPFVGFVLIKKLFGIVLRWTFDSQRIPSKKRRKQKRNISDSLGHGYLMAMGGGCLREGGACTLKTTRQGFSFSEECNLEYLFYFFFVFYCFFHYVLFKRRVSHLVPTELAPVHVYCGG